jgi:hypothetical protein
MCYLEVLLCPCSILTQIGLFNGVFYSPRREIESKREQHVPWLYGTLPSTVNGFESINFFCSDPDPALTLISDPDSDQDPDLFMENTFKLQII